jgi:hypothetical protein
MSTVFINYRTGDEDGTAALVDRELSRRFRSGQVFRAGKSIPPGAVWPQEILTAVRGSSAFLAIIGPRWLHSSRNGQRALDRESDWNRREIVEALTHHVPVIPILVGLTPILTEEDLPPVLAPLAARQHLRLDHHDPEPALDRLTRTLTTWISPQPSRPFHRPQRTTSTPGQRRSRPS